jgi:hypothetical protein
LPTRYDPGYEQNEEPDIGRTPLLQKHPPRPEEHVAPRGAYGEVQANGFCSAKLVHADRLNGREPQPQDYRGDPPRLWRDPPMNPGGRSRRTAGRRSALVGSLLTPLLCGGCLFAPSAAELREAGSAVSSRAIEKASGVVEQRLTEAHAEERLRQITETLGKTLTRAADNLVAVARETPANITKAITAEDSVQTVLKDVSGLVGAVDHAVVTTEASTEALRTAVADLRLDLTRDGGILDRQRAAIFKELRQEREAIVTTLQHERSIILAEMEAMSQRLADQASKKMTEITDVSAPRLLDHVIEKVRALIPAVVGLGVLLFLVVCGLPFAAGVLVGRFTRRRARD